MQKGERDNFGNWCIFLLGSLMVSSGFTKLYGYVTTGHIVHRQTRHFPLSLAGSDAALFYGLFFLIGAFLLAAGIRGPLAK
jgi:hypothetical protein